MWSSHEIIDLVTPRLPRGHIDSFAVSNVRALAEQLPDIFSSYYLECRLSEPRGQVDFLACLAASPDGEEMQRLSTAAERSQSALAHEPIWSLVWNCVQRWSSPALEWFRKLPFLWLEFDHVNARSVTRQLPSLCVCVDASYLGASPPSVSPASHEASYEHCMDFLSPALLPAFPGLLSANRRRLMATCFRRLSPHGRMIHVSCMLAREPMTLKLYGAVPREYFVGYLKDIGWPGSFYSLQRIMHTFCTPETSDDTVYFDLAVDDALLPYVGIAFSQLQLKQPASSDPRRRALLGIFRDQGLCAPDGRSELETWPGSARESHPTTSARARIHRWLDLKLTLHPNLPAGAKGYLGFAPVRSIF